jgi:hypothetical protein
MDSCAVGKEGQFRRQMNSLLVQRFTIHYKSSQNKRERVSKKPIF